MKLSYVPNDMDGPGFYRCMSPASQLVDKAGYKAQFPRVRKEDDGTLTIVGAEQVTMADAYVLQQPKSGHWAGGYIEGLQKEFGIKVVVDVDDNYLELPPENPAATALHPYYHRRRGKILSRKERRLYARAEGIQRLLPINPFNWDNLHDAIKQADMLTVSTPHLAEVYSKLNPNVHVVRNYVDWDIWEDVTPQYEVERERLRVGYLGSFRFHWSDLRVLKPWFGDWLRLHPEVDFVTNNEETHDFLDVPKEQRITIGGYSFFPDDPNEPYPVGKMTAVCDIGLVPLELTPFNEGKSHLKGMEYNAAGIPFIASPTESYCYWTVDAYNGFTAAQEADWVETLNLLAGDGAVRRKMGRNGRIRAKQHSIQENWQRWDAVFQKLLPDGNRRVAFEGIRVGAVQKPTELATFLDRVEKAKPEVIVEIGTANGGTLYSMDKVTDATIFSIDIPAGSVNDVNDNGQDVYGRKDDYREKIKTFGKDVRLIDANSQDVATLMKLKHMLHPRKKIDLLFIDGDHTYEGVKRDYELYSPLVKKGGMIVFHDIVEHDRETVGVKRFWDELKTSVTCHTEEIVFEGEGRYGDKPWGGIGVLYV